MDEFYREVRSRKSLVPSSRRRKSGVRSLQCTLPSDRLTNKEWIERNGPVMTYNLNKPMSWEQFTSSDLSNQAKEEYLNHLIERFCLNQRIFAEMFGVSVATLARTIKRLELNVNFVKGRFPSAEQLKSFEQFLNPEEEQVEQEPQVESIEEEIVVQENAEPMRMNEVSLKFSGLLDIDAVANSLKMILGGNATGEMEIVCRIR